LSFNNIQTFIKSSARKTLIYKTTLHLPPTRNISITMTDNQGTSTLGSYVDAAVGAVQQGIGSLTGNTTDQAQGQAKQDSASTENDLSHAAAKAGPFTLGSSGAVAKDSSDRTAGSWNQTVGAAKEAVGGLVGSESLKQGGQQQNAQGKAQEASGQLSDIGSGLADRLTGTVGAAGAQLLGKTDDQAKYQQQHDVGKTLQRGVETDLQKQVEAQQSKTDPSA
jgi:uncharacterized protein YjbJ (UPF0337 family)